MKETVATLLVSKKSRSQKASVLKSSVTDAGFTPWT